MNFTIEPIPDFIVSEVRRSMVSPQYRSLTAVTSVANGYGPCRSCLQVFKEAEDRRIYFTYNAFEGLSELPGPGPVFIHEYDCPRFSENFPEDLRLLPIVFEAFGRDGGMLERRRMVQDTAESQIDEMLSKQEAEFVNLRNAEAGCFIARAVRRTVVSPPA